MMLLRPFVALAGLQIGVLGFLLCAAPHGWASPPAQPAWVATASSVGFTETRAHLAQDPATFERLRVPTVWEAVDHLIPYRDTLYLVGSTPYTNHNSADIYRYDPLDDSLRYETQLFSQDAGTPVVADGLLYYPAEDPRFSAGVGEYYVTDGERWAWVQASAAPAFHFHAMAEHDGRLFAAAAEWNGLLYASRDAGRHWRRLYSHPTPPRRVTRLNGMIVYRGDLYVSGYAFQQVERFLFRLRGDTLSAVEAVPPARWTRLLAVFRGWLYLYLLGGEAPGLYRTDGRTAERIEGFDGTAVSDGLADGETLLLAGRRGPNGILWHSTDGQHFFHDDSLANREPVSLARLHGRVYLGVRAAGGRGELWVSRLRQRRGSIETVPLYDLTWRTDWQGETPPGTEIGLQLSHNGGAYLGPGRSPEAVWPWSARESIPFQPGDRLRLTLAGTEHLTPLLRFATPKQPAVPPLPRPAAPEFSEPELARRLTALAAIDDLEQFWDVRPLVKGMIELAPSSAPRVADWLGERLGRAYPDRTVGLFGGKTPVRVDWLLRHYLLMGAALNRNVPIDPSWWEAPFTPAPNDTAKYFSPHEAALFAAGIRGQDDPRTIRSLIGLLRREGIPLWLQGDAIGALTRITGQRYGYDAVAWADWLHRTYPAPALRAAPDNQ